MTIEVRTYTGPVEFRKEGDRLLARGYGAVFDSLSKDLGGFVERILPGAFDEVLASSQDPVALANHDANLLLGRRSAGTLRLESDDTGLAYEIDLPDTTVGRDWATLLERRDVIGSSFGFRVAPKGDRWGEDEDGRIVRTIENFSHLRDVGPVTFPAYEGTDVALRSLHEGIAALTDPAPDRYRFRRVTP